MKRNAKKETKSNGAVIPIGDRILVKLLEDEYEGLLLVPETAVKEPPTMALVITLGSGKLVSAGVRKPFEVAIGDKIVVSKYGGTELEINDETFKIYESSDVLAIVEG